MPADECRFINAKYRAVEVFVESGDRDVLSASRRGEGIQRLPKEVYLLRGRMTNDGTFVCQKVCV